MSVIARDHHEAPAATGVGGRSGARPDSQARLGALGNRAVGRLVAGQGRGALARQLRPELSSAGQRRLARVVGRLRCTAGVASAPADPATEVADIDRRAHDMAEELARDLAADAATVAAGGVPAAPSASLQSYLDHFGLPTAAGRGFLNRITGVVRPTQDAATVEELRILSRRFALIARFLSDRVLYACGAGAIDLGGGCTDNCSSNDFDAFMCRGASGMGFCPSFWTGYADNTARAAIVIHELFHGIFGVSNPRGLGEVGDETLRGPGRNFDVAGCYEFLVDDVFTTNSGAACPPVP